MRAVGEGLPGPFELPDLPPAGVAGDHPAEGLAQRRGLLVGPPALGEHRIAEGSRHRELGEGGIRAEDPEPGGEAAPLPRVGDQRDLQPLPVPDRQRGLESEDRRADPVLLPVPVPPGVVVAVKRVAEHGTGRLAVRHEPGQRDTHGPSLPAEQPDFELAEVEGIEVRRGEHLQRDARKGPVPKGNLDLVDRLARLSVPGNGEADEGVRLLFEPVPPALAEVRVAAVGPDLVRIERPPGEQVRAQVRSQLVERRRTGGELLPALPAQLGEPAVDAVSLRSGPLVEDPDARSPVGVAGEYPLLLDVGEECRHRIEVPGQEGVELVVVALGASQRRAQPHRRDVAHPVGRVLGEVLLRLGATLVGHAAQAVVAARHQLRLGRIGQQVRGEVLARHDIEGRVLVEGPDDIVAERVDIDRNVPVIARRVRVPDQVQPVDRHALAVVRGLEHGIQEPLVGVRPAIPREGLGILRPRRQAGQVEADAAGQRPAVSLLHGPQALFGEPCVHQMVDRSRAVGRVRPLRPDVGPVLLVLGALLDPRLDQLLLAVRQPLVGRDGRHHQHGTRLADAVDQPAARGVPGLDHPPSQHLLAPVQAQVGLPGIAIRAVAGEAVLGKDGADVAVELHPLGGWRDCNRRGRQGDGKVPHVRSSGPSGPGPGRAVPGAKPTAQSHCTSRSRRGGRNRNLHRKRVEAPCTQGIEGTDAPERGDPRLGSSRRA